jgi:hypothetical protein
MESSRIAVHAENWIPVIQALASHFTDQDIASHCDIWDYEGGGYGERYFLGSDGM